MPATRSTRRNQETKTASTEVDGALETAISGKKRGLSVTGASRAKRLKRSNSSGVSKQPESESKGQENSRDKDTPEADNSSEKLLDNEKIESIKKSEPEDEKEEEEEAGKSGSTKDTAPRKRSSKEEPSAKMNPLASRASGLRMFVGAHVSAAKGVFHALESGDMCQMLLFLRLRCV